MSEYNPDPCVDCGKPLGTEYISSAGERSHTIDASCGKGADVATCGTCHRSFPDIYPSARCPYEYDHVEEDDSPQHTCNEAQPSLVDACIVCWHERDDLSSSPSAKMLPNGYCDECGSPCILVDDRTTCVYSDMHDTVGSGEGEPPLLTSTMIMQVLAYMVYEAK